jgi:hypothetical protein
VSAFQNLAIINKINGFSFQYGALCPQLYQKLAVYPVSRWTRLWYLRRKPRTSFKSARASPDAVCNLRHCFCFFPGRPVAMSCLAAVIYAWVSTVRRHVLWVIQLLVTRLGSAFSEMIVNACRWGINAHAGVRYFPPALARFPTVCRFYFPLPDLTLSALWHFRRFPCVPWRSFVTALVSVICCRPSIWVSTEKIICFPIVPISQSFSSLFRVGGGGGYRFR